MDGLMLRVSKAFPQPTRKNAAGRLYVLLTQFKGNTDPRKFIKNWFVGGSGDSFPVDSGTELQRILAEQYHTLRADLDSLEIPNAKAIASMFTTQEKQLFAAVYTGHLVAQRPVSNELLTMLDAVADVLPVESEIPSEDGQSVVESVGQLRESIQSQEDLDPELQEMLGDIATLGESVLVTLDREGAEAAKATYEAMLGKLAVAYLKTPESERKEQEEQGPLRRAAKVILTTNSVLSLIERIKNYLPDPSEIANFPF